MCFLKKFCDKHTTMFKSAEIFCATIKSSFIQINFLIKIWIEICICFISKVIVFSRTNFLFMICCRFDMGRFTCIKYILFTFLTVPISFYYFYDHWIVNRVFYLLDLSFFCLVDKVIGYLPYYWCCLIHGFVFHCVHISYYELDYSPFM